MATYLFAFCFKYWTTTLLQGVFVYAGALVVITVLVWLLEGRSWSSLAACHSSESIDVVGTGLSGVVAASGAALVALFHVLEHLSALGVGQLVGRSTEVR